MRLIPPYLLLTISMAATLAYTVMRNVFSKSFIRSDASYYSFNGWTSVCSAVTLILMNLSALTGSAYSLLLGVAFGVLTLLAALFNMMALNIGPMAYTTVIITASMMIPALSGRIFWNEPVSWYQYAGMVLMLCSAVCAVDPKSGDQKASVRWVVFCLLSFVCSGSIGVMQKIHQASAHSQENACFLVTAFAVSALASAVIALYKKRRQPKSAAEPPHGKKAAAVVLMTVLSGVFIAFGNQFNLYLSGVMDSAVFFPLVNGGGMLLAGIAGIVLFGERFTRRQWFGMGLGVGAVLLLCI